MAPNNQKSELKIIQINLNRCKAAHDLLQAKLTTEEIDIVIGQKPNQNYLVSCISDNNRDCFIKIDRKLKILNIQKGKGYVMVELPNLRICSCYFSPNGNTEDF